MRDLSAWLAEVRQRYPVCRVEEHHQLTLTSCRRCVEQDLLDALEAAMRVVEVAEELRMWCVDPPEGSAFLFDPSFIKIKGKTKQDNCQAFDQALTDFRAQVGP